MSKRNELFVLEDNKELLSEIAEMATSLNWEVHRARSVSEAAELARSLPNPPEGIVSLALIDLMLPSTFYQLAQLDELQKQRESVVMQFMEGAYERSLSPTLARDARARLDVIDDQIRSLIKADGGLTFLRENPDFTSHRNIVVFSARDQDKLKPDVDQILSPNRLVEWIQKPVPPDRIDQLLKRFTQGNV